MLPALAVKTCSAELPSWAAGEDTKRARGESSPDKVKVKEGSDDGGIKSAGPSRPAVGERQRFSQAHGSASNGLNRPLNHSIGKMLARISEKKGRAFERTAECAEKIRPAET